MKEIIFIKKNVDRWNSFEKSIATEFDDKPDDLASMFIQITDDLSYSRTFYPESDTTKYLNIIASKAHQKIYKNKKENRNLLKLFWATELPLLIYNNMKFLFIALLIFLSASLVGAFSAANDTNFLRTILGDQYVDMTISNIEKGKPMNVYNTTDEMNMFVAIAFNNIRVSFLAFILGLFAGIGSIIILLQNGIMLGSFQYFFYKYGLLKYSALTIWIHGTLEIFVIIVAGAAGMIMGSSLIYPKTYTRLYSFKSGVKIGIKYIIGVIPMFIIAAFLEGFVTRHTEFSSYIKLSIILFSLAFIIWYFFIYPVKVAIKHKIQKNNLYTKLINTCTKYSCFKLGMTKHTS